MLIKGIELENFRNYGGIKFSFDESVNVIVGDNAKGKTNLLESIGYLSNCKSHRANSDSELIEFSKSSARISASIISRSRDFEIEIILRQSGKRSIKSNGVKYKTVSELSGLVKTVLFCPEHTSMIKGGSVERRRFLDDGISQLRPNYAMALSRYKRLLEQKRALLKRDDFGEMERFLLEDYNTQLSYFGASIIRYRAYFADRLSEIARDIHSDFTNGKEKLGIEYETDKSVRDAKGSGESIRRELFETFSEHFETEIASHKCLVGIQKDDLSININGLSVRRYGSQGQSRTSALSLELAERDIFFDNDGEYPILLLDDVLSELDPKRQEYILNRIKGGQIFITCCESDRLTSLLKGKVIAL